VFRQDAAQGRVCQELAVQPRCPDCAGGARFMGTSVEQIDRTYGHLLPDSIDRTRAALNTFLAAQAQAREEAGG
jgi:hypothetical protein